MRTVERGERGLRSLRWLPLKPMRRHSRQVLRSTAATTAVSAPTNDKQAFAGPRRGARPQRRSLAGELRPAVVNRPPSVSTNEPNCRLRKATRISRREGSGTGVRHLRPRETIGVPFHRPTPSLLPQVRAPAISRGGTVKKKDDRARDEEIEARRSQETWDGEGGAGAPRPVEGGAVESTPRHVSSPSRGSGTGVEETGAGG